MNSANTAAPSHRLHLRVTGWVPESWAERFNGLSVRYSSDGTSVICGDLTDQSAFFGMMRALDGLGMKVVAVFAYPGGAN